MRIVLGANSDFLKKITSESKVAEKKTVDQFSSWNIFFFSPEERMTSFAERPPGFNPTRVAAVSASPIENGRTVGSRKEKQAAASAPVELKSNRSNFFLAINI